MSQKAAPNYVLLQLEDTSRDNIDRMNARLEIYGRYMRAQLRNPDNPYRFASEETIIRDYEFFTTKLKLNRWHVKDFDPALYPPSQIKDFADFVDCYVSAGWRTAHPVGSLVFDLGTIQGWRYPKPATPKCVIKCFGRFFCDYITAFAGVKGDFESFMKQGMGKAQAALAKQWHTEDAEILSIP